MTGRKSSDVNVRCKSIKCNFGSFCNIGNVTSHIYHMQEVSTLPTAVIRRKKKDNEYRNARFFQNAAGKQPQKQHVLNSNK